MKAKEGAARTKQNMMSPRLVRTLAFTLAAVICLVVVVTGVQFTRSYARLRVAIQAERMDYVQEISQQIITCQQFMKKEYSNAIVNYAGIINRAEIAGFSDAHANISSKDAEAILLISDRGQIYNLDGSSVYLSDRRLMQNLPKGDEVFQLFCSLNYTDDHWLFAARIDPFTFDGQRFTTVVLAVSADEFRDSLAISLFDGRGASYIVKNDGSIEIMAADVNLAFDGYNLFASMIRLGAAQTDVAMLEEDMWNSTEGDYLFDIGGNDWLISHSAIDSESSIVVAVPLAITAAQTYEGLSSTILSASATVMAVAILAVELFLYYGYRDRQRSREVMAVAAKSDFFSKMSHDIRTPLNAIVGLDLLARERADDPQVKEYLRQSSAAADYLLSIINDVLDMSRIESGKIEIANAPFDMNALISEVRSLGCAIADEKNLRLEVTRDKPFAWEYLGDKVRIKQILMNLLSNATKFTKEGGQVKLHVSHRAGADGKDDITFTVTDNGIGMSEEFLSRIFLPFEQERSSYTQQFAGSGLGLSIAHNMVTLMGGTINVKSQEGAGSTFTITIPLARGAVSTHTDSKTGVVLTTFTGCNVLLAEDNAVNLQIAVTILRKKFDLIVEVAHNGREAVDKFASSREGHYSLILMDIKMPILDGLEATRQIRALPRPDAKSVPIVALSANAFEEDVALSLKAGMNDHLSKPIEIEALGRALSAYIKKEAPL